MSLHILFPLVMTIFLGAGCAPSAPIAVPAVPLPILSPQNGNIRVLEPLMYAQIAGSLLVTGEARVFESAFSWRVLDAAGQELLSGSAMADAPDIGQFGPFTFTADLSLDPPGPMTLEVFDYSAKDGAVQDLVSIPFTKISP